MPETEPTYLDVARELAEQLRTAAMLFGELTTGGEADDELL